MNPLSVDIKDLIVEIDAPWIFGTNLFIGKEPATPDTCITVYDTGGKAQNGKLAYDESTVQVRARGKDYTATWGHLNTIRTALQSSPILTTVDGATIIGIWVSSTIMCLGTDTLDRYIFTINFRVLRELSQSQAGHRLSTIS